jgi:hypothetical protein
MQALRTRTRLRTRAGFREIVCVRLLFAGRDVGAFWDGYAAAYAKPPVPLRINLTPFNAHPIQELIWQRARGAGVNVLDDQTVVEVADEVCYLSGGHPQVIRRLVDALADDAFVMDGLLPADYFARHRADCVSEHLLEPAAALLADIPAEVQDAVTVLSIFRRINAGTVLALVQAGFLPETTDAIALLGQLHAAHLLDKPRIQEPFYRDHVMQRILALRLAYESATSSARYQQLNRFALDLYAGWIQAGLQDPYQGPTQRLFSVIEWLFHALHVPDVDVVWIRQTLSDYRCILCGDDAVACAATDLIVTEIEKDVEVCYLLRHALGEDGVSTVCAWLQSTRPD